MTMAIRDGMKAGKFQDNARIERLDIQFASRYIVTREQYFAGEREAFDVELDLAGTPLRRRVWRALRALPYGDITT